MPITDHLSHGTAILWVVKISTSHNIKHHKLHKHKEELLNLKFVYQPCPAEQPLGPRHIYNTASCSTDLTLTFDDYTLRKVQNV